MKALKLLSLLFLLAFSSSFAQTNWTFDKAHSKIGFAVTHLLIAEVDGNFKSFEGSVVSPDENFDNSKISFNVDINSIFTENEKRDAHLKSDDFFNAEKYPQMTFTGKSFKQVDGKNYKLVGDLTIRDITKEVELDVVFNGSVKDPWGNTKAGFSLSGVINRFDYGLKWNAAIETGGLVVSENVKINGNIELAKQETKVSVK